MSEQQQDPRARAQRLVELAGRAAELSLRPGERTFYKLKQAGRNGAPPAQFNGSCLRIQLRLDPAFKVLPSGREVVDARNNDGGLFLDLVPQKQGLNAAGFAEGDWESPASVTAKLGLPDVTGMLAAYYAVRQRGGVVPSYLQGGKEPQPNRAVLFHNSSAGGGTGTLVLNWTFDAEQSTIEMSKSKLQRQHITLTYGEELAFVDYLELALRAFNLTGHA